MEEVDRLKQQGNEKFVQKNFSEADDLYSQALQLCTDEETRKIILTNRSATKLSLGDFRQAVEDADEALKIDPLHVKGYYRKAAALEGWNKLGEAYYTWLDAAKNCDADNETIVKQSKKTKQNWLKVFRLPNFPISDTDDLVHRILLFTDKRERLSTLAHFWNSSSQQERFGYFQALLQLIGGSGEISEANQDNITPEVMVEMPMGNYIDMPRSRLADWFDFFETLDESSKTSVFRQVWLQLSSEEQNDVIRDLRYLFSHAAPVAMAVAIPDDN